MLSNTNRSYTKEGKQLLPPHLLNVRIQPISLPILLLQILRPRNPPLTNPVLPTNTLKRLNHLPLRARVEEAEHVTLAQRPVPHHAHLHAVHVEDERGVAGVVDKDEVGVELDVRGAAGLHGGVGFCGGGCGGNFGEDGAGGEVDEGDGRAGEGFGAAVDEKTVRVGRLFFGCSCSCSSCSGCGRLFDCNWRHFGFNWVRLRAIGGNWGQLREMSIECGGVVVR